ncbi:hypothetical protein [Sporomusa malonica]|uniref:Uncharacterized protein n=1 Tax=Sporomusa malonica TaxID=112901 RepID=A0A1W2E624_9FIRM|nr:hypothetical protein [Sporomusa malonica]SMD05233.1 hypothetical protein SAMN04488500_12123 [Sporomusa malonica]
MRTGFPQSPKQRRPKAAASSIATNFLHLRNPFVVAWMSASFPGFGHISLGNYVIGFVLFGWEMLVNTQANLNIAIIYSVTGRYEMAKEIVNNRWLLFYAPVWVFAIWSSYHLTVDLNKLSILADRNQSPIDAAFMSFFEINVLDKRSPWVAVFWTMCSPGLGHLYTHRIPTGFFLLIWWIVMAYFSHLLQAAQYTALGLFEQATTVLDLEWVLYLPSIMGFAIYDVYVNTVEYNRLFDREQADYLTREYQASDFNMPK